MTTTYDDPFRVRYDACPVCDDPRIDVLREADWSRRPDYRAPLPRVIRWMQCAHCGHQFTWGYHTEEAFAVLFGHAQVGQTAAGMTSAQIESHRGVWSKVVDAVARHRFGGEWLDVGAGAGMLAAVAQECGFDVVTMESRPDVADALRERGLPVLTEDVLRLGEIAPGRFSVVSLCDVLEHIPYPRPVLDAVWQGLRPDGIVFISCPNADSLAWRATDAESTNPYWAEIEHFHNFSYRRMAALLAEHGFEALSCSVSNRYRVCMDVVARRVEHRVPRSVPQQR